MADPTPDVQPAFVPKFYEMDPEVDDLLPDGTYLRDGMVVLLEDSLLRGDPERLGLGDTMARYELDRCREVNRWCEVSHLSVTPRYHSDSGPLVEFIATYPDGTKRKRAYAASYAWFVRRFSVSTPDNGAAAARSIADTAAALLLTGGEGES